MEKKTNALENIAVLPNLAEIFIEILKLTVPLNKQIENCVISTTNNEKLNDILNDCKQKTLKSANLLIEFLIGMKKEKNFEENAGILKNSGVFLSEIFRSLIKFMGEKEVLEEIANKNTENLLIQMVVFMKNSCLLEANHKFFQMNYQA